MTSMTCGLQRVFLNSQLFFWLYLYIICGLIYILLKDYTSYYWFAYFFECERLILSVWFCCAYDFWQTANHWWCLVNSRYLSAYKVTVTCSLPRFPSWAIECQMCGYLHSVSLYSCDDRASPGFFLCAMATLCLNLEFHQTPSGLSGFCFTIAFK